MEKTKVLKRIFFVTILLIGLALIINSCEEDPPPLSSDKLITSLTLNDGIKDITGVINGLNVSFSEKAAVGVEEVLIKSIIISDNARSSKNNGDRLAVGESTITITAADGSSNSYLINILVTDPTLATLINLTASQRSLSGFLLTVGYQPGNVETTRYGLLYSDTISEESAFVFSSSDNLMEGIQKIEGSAPVPSGNVFNFPLTGLSHSTTFYCRIYARNSVGYSYSNLLTVSTETPLPFRLGSIMLNSITPTIATFTIPYTLGTTTIGEYGIEYGLSTSSLSGGTFLSSTNLLSTINEISSGSLSLQITGLSSGTLYWTRAYAKDNLLGRQYSDILSIMTATPTPVMLTNLSGNNIRFTSFDVSVDYTVGNSAVTEYGFVYSSTVSGDDLILGNVDVDEIRNTDLPSENSFNSSLLDLSLNTVYYVRAYAENMAGLRYSNQLTVITPLPYRFTSLSFDTIDFTSFNVSSSIISGNPLATGYGFVYSSLVSGDDLVLDSSDDIIAIENVGSPMGDSFSASITNISHSTTYYVKSYVTNSGETTYSTQDFLMTRVPTFITLENLSGNNIDVSSFDASVDYTEGNNPTSGYGFIYSSTLLDDDLVLNATGINMLQNIGAPLSGSDFNASITGLTQGTTYYFRAYATNIAGTVYSNQESITTSGATPIVINSISGCFVDIEATDLEITFSASYTEANNPVTSYGFLYSKTLLSNDDFEIGEPDVIQIDNTGDPVNQQFSNTISISGGTEIIVEDNVSSVIGGTYYLRAYATNTFGTTYYSNPITFDAPYRGGDNRVVNYRLTEATPTSLTIVFDVYLGGGRDSNGRNSVYHTHRENHVFLGNGLNTARPENIGVLFLTNINSNAPNRFPNLIGNFNYQTVTHTFDDLRPDTNYEIAFVIDFESLTIVTDTSFRGRTLPGTLATVNISQLNNDFYSFDLMANYQVGNNPTFAYGFIYSDRLSGDALTLSGGISISGSLQLTPPAGVYQIMGTGLDVMGNGSFMTAVTGLNHSTIYYAKAYALNYTGIDYDELDVMTLVPQSVRVSNLNVSTISYEEVDLSLDYTPGNSAIGEYGFIYSSAVSGDALTLTGGAFVTNISFAGDPGRDGSGFPSQLTNLTHNTTYYVKAYATDNFFADYSNQIHFTTLEANVRSTIGGISVSSINVNSFRLIAENHIPGMPATADYGFIYSPTLLGDRLTLTGGADVMIYNQTGNPGASFSTTIDFLDAQTTYYARAYVRNPLGVDYSPQLDITTLPTTPVNLDNLNRPGNTTANSFENISVSSYTLGSSPTTSYGFLYSETLSGADLSISFRGVPATGAVKVEIGSTLSGTFTGSIVGLSSSMLYYVRAYAINPGGVEYSDNDLTLHTTGPVVLNPLSVSDITNTRATIRATVFSTNARTITEYGFVYSFMLSGDNLNVNTGTKEVVSISNYNNFEWRSQMQIGQRFYVRGYATNSSGTSYTDVLEVQNTSNWVRAGDLPVASSGFAVFERDNRFYILPAGSARSHAIPSDANPINTYNLTAIYRSSDYRSGSLTWTKVGDIDIPNDGSNNPREGWGIGYTVDADGRAYIATGEILTVNDLYSSDDVYVSAANDFTSFAPPRSEIVMNDAVILSGATLLSASSLLLGVSSLTGVSVSLSGNNKLVVSSATIDNSPVIVSGSAITFTGNSRSSSFATAELSGSSIVFTTHIRLPQPTNASPLAYYKGYVYVLGGGDDLRVPGRNVYRSNDGGVSWEFVRTTGYPSKQRHSGVVFDNKLWVFGGVYSSDNRVYHTTDGANWQSQVANNPSGFFHGKPVVFDNSVWSIGGLTTGLVVTGTDSMGHPIYIRRETNATAFRSSDMVNWVEIDFPTDSRNYYPAVIVADNKIWMMGGASDGNRSSANQTAIWTLSR